MGEIKFKLVLKKYSYALLSFFLANGRFGELPRICSKIKKVILLRYYYFTKNKLTNTSSSTFSFPSFSFSLNFFQVLLF
jgi:hypothetical protein